MNDLISRQAAIDAIRASTSKYTGFMEMEMYTDDDAVEAINGVPSAQSEIVRCKDCKYRDENWRRVSVRWLPCMDVRTGSNWYCGSAEREDDE